MARTELVPRIYGSEIEYGVTVREKGKAVTFLLPPGIPALGQFLRNGARSYLDIGEHPEYATAESSTLRDLVTQEIVGEILTTEAYVHDPQKEDDDRPVYSLHKRSISENGAYAAGAHESYLTTNNIWDGEKKNVMIGVLAGHNATRTVFAGAGQPRGRMFRDNDYSLAQKMESIEELSSKTTTTRRPLVNTKPEHLNGQDEQYYRFHNIAGDANISPWVIRMKFGTTSLMLRLLEHDIPMEDLQLDNPVLAAHTVAEGRHNLTTPLKLKNGTASALNLQEEYHNRARLLAERFELPKEELTVMDDWITVIDNLKSYAQTHEPTKYLERLDWYTKREIFMGFVEKHGPLTEKQFEKLVLSYDRTVTGIGVNQRRPGRRFSIDMPSQDELDAGRLTPPPGRAVFRGEFIQRATTNPVPNIIYRTDWGNITMGELLQLPPLGDYSPTGIAEKMEIVSRIEHARMKIQEAA
jgi:proteasome accessory factor A